MLLYRLLLTLAAPAVAVLFALRRLRGRETLDDLRQRLATTDEPPLPGPRIWLHGASVGELAAARGLIEALLEAHPELQVTITANTTTGRDCADYDRFGLLRTESRLAPVDTRPALRRFLATHRPAALVVIENELWPNRMALARARGLPVIVASARLSARSARRWAYLPGLAREVLGAITALYAQDADSAQRFTVLGLPAAARAETLALKFVTPPPPVDPEALAALAPAFDRAETLLAASTHAGEEAQVLEAFAEARKARPDLRLILAPRHATRSAEVAAAIRAAGLPFATRSAGEGPGDAPVYLADTMGEMGLWYSLARLCFIGGSLVDRGGHTPLEPAQFGCALLHGPSTFNQAEAFAALTAAGAARETSDAPSLAHALTGITPEAATRMGEAARDAAAARRADIAPLLARIETTAGLVTTEG